MTELTEPEPPPTDDVLSSVFGERAELSVRYVRSLADDGVVRGLIGPRESGRLWSRHVLNSAVVAPLLAPSASVVDVGSGAGLPGIPLAIARADCTLILVEPLLRRTVYLAEIVAELGLTNVRVLRGRAEDVVGKLGADAVDGADAVTSRAVAPLGKLARWSVPLLRVGGQFLPLKGASAADEIARDAAELTALGLGPARVIEVGEGIVDPVTHVVSAELLRRPPTAAPPKSKPARPTRRR
jgi:16S rRNA (guanine527-N7)-methyltransferase